MSEIKSNACYCHECKSGPWLHILYEHCLECNHGFCLLCEPVYIPPTKAKSTWVRPKMSTRKRPSSSNQASKVVEPSREVLSQSAPTSYVDVSLDSHVSAEIPDTPFDNTDLLASERIEVPKLLDQPQPKSGSALPDVSKPEFEESNEQGPRNKSESISDGNSYVAEAVTQEQERSLKVGTERNSRNTAMNNKVSELLDDTRMNALSAENREHIKRLFVDIEDVHMEHILISNGGRPQGLVAIVQAYVEQSTGTTWDWWPLQVPQTLPREGDSLVTWQCSCGEQRWSHIPRFIGDKLTEMFVLLENTLKRHGFPGIVDVPPTQHPSSASTGGVFGVSLGLPQASQLPPTASVQSTSAAHGASSPSKSLVSGRTNQMRGPDAVYNRRLVFFAANKGEEHRLAQLETDGVHDDAFFDQLRHTYVKLRGPIRELFSIWRYAGSDFFMFEKIEPREIVPRGKGMPDPEHSTYPQYHYTPKPRGPADPDPPISRHEFKKRFYTCYRGHNKHQHHFWSCRKPCRPKGEALEKIPKRNQEVNEESDSRDTFWGLLAVEEPQLFRVIVYHVLFIAGPFSFWALWLTIMGHSGDLQGASVPFTTALGLMSLLWFPLLNRQQKLE